MFRVSTIGRGEPLKVMGQKTNKVGEKLQDNLQRGSFDVKGSLSFILLLDTRKSSVPGTVDSLSYKQCSKCL